MNVRKVRDDSGYPPGSAFPIQSSVLGNPKSLNTISPNPLIPIHKSRSQSYQSKKKMPAIISVIGSLNVDLVTRTARVPVGGETLTSESFAIGWGGKGANQAVACARLSRTQAQAQASSSSSSSSPSSPASAVQVRMVGAVGADEFHAQFLQALEADGVNTAGVRVLPGKKTGVAVILVETGTGENRILVSPGANGHVDAGADLVDRDASVALFQLELPLQVVLGNMKSARQKGVVTVLNPAPAVVLPVEAYEGLHHLIVNETEAVALSGGERPAGGWDEVAAIFIERGVKNVIITLGGEAASQKGCVVPARKVKVVDTTAAGDTFAGAYTVAVARWKSMEKEAEFDLDAAIAYANRAASVTVQREGAQSSIPWADEVPGA
ncbi:ribokinase [Pyrenophora seminiperda CCB06]|uniref:Ribokinase n=1 Tax=Pyrenophora seminiperda CCB06 TaxID=1302712 RepID=A0A3M7M1M7_9PLEO|nr:ribokinase [Pyrenophora seminiperda CCB06]